jgi:hypothetical protein
MLRLFQQLDEMTRAGFGGHAMRMIETFADVRQNGNDFI